MGRREGAGIVRPPTLTPHAVMQCRRRAFDLDAVARQVAAKVADVHGEGRAVAAYVGRIDGGPRGGLVGSNGDTVWAIVREGRIVTVMLRRSTQPATPDAFGVDVVAGPRR